MSLTKSQRPWVAEYYELFEVDEEGVYREIDTFDTLLEAEQKAAVLDTDMHWEITKTRREFIKANY